MIPPQSSEVRSIQFRQMRNANVRILPPQARSLECRSSTRTLRPDLPRSTEVAERSSFCASRCSRTRPFASILHAVAVHAPDIVQPSHHAKVDDLLDGLHARLSAIISRSCSCGGLSLLSKHCIPRTTL